MRIFRTLILLSVVLAGCSHQAELDTWYGASLNDLMMVYGPPDKVASLDGGGQLVEYDRNSQIDGTDYPCRIWFVLTPREQVQSGHSKGACGLDVMPRQALRN